MHKARDAQAGLVCALVVHTGIQRGFLCRGSVHFAFSYIYKCNSVFCAIIIWHEIHCPGIFVTPTTFFFI